MRNTRKAFTLIEILMASLVFTIITIGIASTFQAALVAGRATTDMSACQRELREGLRLLRDGDASTLNQQPGLLEADLAQIAVTGRLQYSISNGAQWYEVWVAQGQLLRRQIYPSTLTSKVLMGEFTPGSFKSRLMLTPDTLAATPVAFLPAGNSIASAAARFVFMMHCDIDGNSQWTNDEMRMEIRPTIFLRNSGQ
ncbi:MAG: hypothetical protein PHV05_02865 [Candidatus Riflebacteria bacterium]|nr:hypothetical protein [Candidatus Riflebacteria bacterium]